MPLRGWFRVWVVFQVFVGQGLVHEFAGYVCDAKVYQLLSRPFAEVLA